MTARAPIETLEAAIEKLERLKAESTPGPWVYGGQGWLFGSLHRGTGEFSDHFGSVIYLDADGELISTLHRTIDAQLAILRDSLESFSYYGEVGGQILPNARALALAEAILGGDE